MGAMNSREIKPHTPPGLVIKAAAIALITVGFVLFAIYEAGSNIRNAKKTGIVTHKEFVPAAETEQQITLSREGEIATRKVEGEFILTVDVKEPDGATNSYRVWLPSREQFDSLDAGDNFDVGPYLVK
jgi:hypothetical protein